MNDPTRARSSRGHAPDPAAADRLRGSALLSVSRETDRRLAIYVDALRRWQSVKNLVAPSTLDQVWTRHVADSAQVLRWAPSDARVWADLGSGAGFPGLVVAILLAENRAGVTVHLIESNARKCAFLREVARATLAPALVHNGRIEDVLPTLKDVDVLTARALAPLPTLLRLGQDPIRSGASAVFLKSQDEVDGMTIDAEFGSLSVEPSMTSEKGRIVVVRPVSHRPGGAASRLDPPSEPEGMVP